MKNVYIVLLAVLLSALIALPNAQAASRIPVDEPGGGDTTPPSVFVYHSPSNPTQGQTVTISASASDDSGLSSIRIFLDNVNVKTCPVNSTSWAGCIYSASNLAAGNHTYFALATDVVGNTGRNPSIGTKSFVVSTSNITDTTPPSVFVQHYPDNPVYGQVVIINVSASDDRAVSQIIIYSDGRNVATCSPGTVFASCLYFASNMSAGNHTYYATAMDTSGNSARDPVTGYKMFTVSQYASVQKATTTRTPISKAVVKTPSDEPVGGGIDTTPPVVYVYHSPYNPAYGQTVVLEAFANDINQSNISYVRIFLDNINVKTCYSSYCRYEKLMLNDSLGNHTYYATAADLYGNIGRDPVSGYKSFTVSSYSSAAQKTSIQKIQIAARSPLEIPVDEPVGGGIDTTPPSVVAYNSPLYPISGQPVWIIANATDDMGLRSVLVYLDSQNIAQCYPSSRFVSCQAAVFNLSAGNHTYYAVANDTSGNVAVAGPEIFYISSSYDTTAPTVYVYSLLTGNNVTLTATATDNAAISNIKIYLDGVNVRTCASSPCVYSKSGIYAGNHTYYATAMDTSGNIGRNPSAGYKTFTISSASRTIIREARVPNSMLDPISSFLSKFAEKLA